MHWHTFQLSTQGLHAVAYAPKTTKAGQPFACTWHGYTDARQAPPGCCNGWPAFHHCLPSSKTPAASQISFSRTRTCNAMLCHTSRQQATHARSYVSGGPHNRQTFAGPAALTPSEAFALTLHSMKSTALATAGPSQGRVLSTRPSSRLCTPLLPQRHFRQPPRAACNCHLPGYRLEASKVYVRGGAPPVPKPPVSIPASIPLEHLSAGDIVSGLWAVFASRHERMLASHTDEPVADAGPQTNSSAASPESPVRIQRRGGQAGRGVGAATRILRLSL